MIRVDIHKDQAGRIESFEMSGHAGFGEYGKDIVCAGASAVVFGNVNAVLSMTESDPGIELDDDGGYLHFDVDDPDDEKLQTILEAMIISLKTIEEEYSEHIRIEYL
ncbi:ribosomal-processing cysteine protease Prp [Lacicoccus alkaliphilus]|uniref:Ribosomal processing cysteine protease Prp n=1 Tax=Lacicoccus alkaliphilus DSM 16010 TaxID=1123231 RepID=A0A1M7BTD6_9BACL|nr:ribosomal-processing cysteine protease Prp [Salinicoccus alkaliphilus]SHL58126.1 hypothetical protein SAMN02745189_00576 [Salinicoccus alkaliphilus DSM 16010]